MLCPCAAYASHSVLSTFFHWRQSTIYDIILQQQLDKWGISDSQVPLYQKLIVPHIQARLQKRIRDNGSVYPNWRPAGNGTANWGKYQYTPGQVRGIGADVQGMCARRGTVPCCWHNGYPNIQPSGCTVWAYCRPPAAAAWCRKPVLTAVVPYHTVHAG
mgnify:FL=1